MEGLSSKAWHTPSNESRVQVCSGSVALGVCKMLSHMFMSTIEKLSNSKHDLHQEKLLSLQCHTYYTVILRAQSQTFFCNSPSFKHSKVVSTSPFYSSCPRNLGNIHASVQSCQDTKLSNKTRKESKSLHIHRDPALQAANDFTKW